MDSQTLDYFGLAAAALAGVLLLVSHGGDVLSLFKAILTSFRGRPKAKPIQDVVTIHSKPGVPDRVEAFQTVKPFLTKTQANAVWVMLEPEGATVDVLPVPEPPEHKP